MGLGFGVKEAFAAGVLCVSYIKKSTLCQVLANTSPALVSHVIADAPIVRLVNSTLGAHRMPCADQLWKKGKKKKNRKMKNIKKIHKIEKRENEKSKKNLNPEGRAFFTFFTFFSQFFHSFLFTLFQGCWDTRTFHASTATPLNTRHETQPHTTGLALWSSLTLETRSHPWVPAGLPQHTGAHHDGEAVDGPTPPQTTSDSTRPLRRLRTNSNMVAEPEMMYGLASVDCRMECAWSVASSGTDEL